MVAVHLAVIAVALAAWVLALVGLFHTERVQRWYARFFLRIPFLWWPYPPEWIEGYFQSRLIYYQTKGAGLVALLGLPAALAVAFLLSRPQ